MASVGFVWNERESPRRDVGHMKVVLVSVSWISKLTYSIIKDDRESTQSYINHIHITYNLIRITQYLINQKSNEEVVAAQIIKDDCTK